MTQPRPFGANLASRRDFRRGATRERENTSLPPYLALRAPYTPRVNDFSTGCDRQSDLAPSAARRESVARQELRRARAVSGDLGDSVNSLAASEFSTVVTPSASRPAIPLVMAIL